MYEKLLRYIVTLNQWRKKHISQDNFLIIAAAIVGVTGGLAASILKKLVHVLANYLQNDFHWQYKFYLFFFFPLIGIFLTVLYVKTFIRKHPFHHGIPPLIKSISQENSRLDFHNIYSQVISSAVTVGMGGSAGLEAPAASSGAAIGSNFGRLFGLNYRETTMLLACGGAAGISAAFGSPIAGMVFALEVLLPAFSIPAFIPLLISSAIASVISKMMHSEPLFINIASRWEVGTFWFYVIFGVVAGFYTIFYSRLNETIPIFFGKIKNKYSKIWAGGIMLGVLVTLFPAIYGEGYITIQKLLDGDYQSLLGNSIFSEYQSYTWILVVFAVLSLIGKTYGCVITMSSGGNGGMFGPSVVIGGLLGFIFAFTMNQSGWVHLNITNFIIAGMAASVSGAMHAPLTGIFLSAEITGGYALIVPLMVVAAISYFINKAFRKYSIYTFVLAEQGSLVTSEDKDASVLMHLKLKYLLEKDFILLSAKDTAFGRRKDIIQSSRNVFPVVDDSGKLLGILSIEELLGHIVGATPGIQDLPISDMVQPLGDKVVIGTRMREVMQLMDKKNIRILPVVDQDNKYLGFVTKNGIFNKYRKLLVRQNDML
ncbi:MAG: chloride channel protein [Sphingobacteriales bacterium UTBCD1]|jgi:CIC family chloride channel protein|nr:MAG: chloride channel protein [Sphingobacteriales bacterium UTBCD1]